MRGQPKEVKLHEVSKPISEIPPAAGPTGAGATGPSIGGAPPTPINVPQPAIPQPPAGNPPTILKPGNPAIKSVIIEN